MVIGLIVVSIIAIALGLKKSPSNNGNGGGTVPQWCDRCLTKADCPESDTGFCCPHLKKCLENSNAGCISNPTSGGCECSNSDFPDKWVGYNTPT